MNKNKWFLNGGRGSGKTFRLLYETYENKIADLEKENKTMRSEIGIAKGYIERIEKENADLHKSYDDLYFSMRTLREENAELKDDNKVMADNYSKMEQKFYDNLTKAKEIIKKFSEFVNNEIEYDPEHPQEHTDQWNKLCAEAEQFISEVEK